jgi:cytochrome b6-f complex iron-sulfur subunit
MKSNPTTDQMKRGEFLRSLGLSSAALMAFYCMGTTMTACSKSSDPSPSTGSGTGTTTPTTSSGLTGNADTSKGAISFTADLTNADFSKLKTQGAFVKVGSVLIANTKSGYVTLQRLCTHEGQDLVSYRLASDDFYCDAHGSTYATNGSVKVGIVPGQAAMKLYKTTPSSDGNSLTVTA